MWPTPPLDAMVTVLPFLDLIIPQATKPSVSRVPSNVIVGTSTMAIPLGRSETYARMPSFRKKLQMGALPSVRLTASIAHDSSHSLTRTLNNVFDAMFTTRRVEPSGEGLA